MSRYQHTKGQINDNALEALLHDPLFRQRVEKNKKGKGSYLRKKINMQNVVTRRPVAKEQVAFLPLAFCFLRPSIKSGCFALLTNRGFLRAILLPCSALAALLLLLSSDG